MRFVLFATAALISVAAISAATAGGSVDHGTIADPCDSGYEWFGKIGECRERHEPRFVEKLKCRPGDVRKVPDPDRPNGYRFQVCGFVKPGGS